MNWTLRMGLDPPPHQPPRFGHFDTESLNVQNQFPRESKYSQHFQKVSQLSWGGVGPSLFGTLSQIFL